MSSLFPTFARYPITIVKGKGSRLWDDQGKEYLDFMTGIAVTSLGHVPERVQNALVSQLDQLWHVSNLFYNPVQEKAAKLLTDNSCADAVFFCNSGAEANEAAIKLARRYHQKVLGNGRYEIVTLTHSFHGRTLATLTATGQDKVKEGFLPLPQGFVHVPLNDLAALEAAITDQTAAVMIELVQAEGGVHLADPAYVKAVRELCDRHGILLILDEVQTGMGRTGKLFAYEHYGIEPDIFTLAKGIASGFPVGAMLGKAALVPAFTAGSHGSTFSGTPIATAAIAATIETMLLEKAPERAAASGELLVSKLKQALAGLPNVTDVRGLGLIVGIECAGPVADIVAELHKRGLLVITAGPNVLRLLPNLLVTAEEIDEAVGIIAAVLSEQAAALSASN
ncbi:acetylornithine transaminase [Cohnella lubricantis]|uniref:Acetylornithine aminotransferase n=1 Tax=Cohnella lubricantis TaxID=2163172 RepID=A0A841TDR7_9BACL|nr:acetylornithine transaminase [Cohnella lubricantis]MBB6677380.1 acetylornithine transaminase [Cohnella lubricantis]MBP2118730.1 acetylornithine aminotransferase [Cohnella lubricantis]